MGHCSTLFYCSSDSDKQTLHRRIRLSASQFEEQRERWNLLADYLVSDLNARSGYPIATWLQGSYKFGTQVRPVRKGEEYDIDLGVYFQWEGLPEDGMFEPQELKHMVQESLSSYGGEGVVEVCSPPKSRCSRIRYTGDFHIDVPVYHLDPSRDSRSLATENNGWENSDPKEFYLWFKNKFDDVTQDKVRRQLRYIKSWAALKFPDVAKRPSSVLLTVLVTEAFDRIPIARTQEDDDCLEAVLEAIVARLDDNPVVRNPVDHDEILTDRMEFPDWEAFFRKLRLFKELAVEANAASSVVVSADKWSEAFEHFFPLPPIEEIAGTGQTRPILPVPVILPEVVVRAVVRNGGHRWNGTNRIGPIPANCDIDFEVTNAISFPPGAEIEWMVRNEGEAAENINDLGHKAGAGLSASEHSAYRGTHYMDCAVKRYGQLISLRRIPVTITTQSQPLRNPPRKRPHWRIKGKR